MQVSNDPMDMVADPSLVESPKDSGSVVATLRSWIIDGRLQAGERLAEMAMAERLGVSRTPVRLAFRTLEQEGLLAKAGKRGYMVRSFSEADVRAALEVRGALEGLAARRLAERGMTPEVRNALIECLGEASTLVSKPMLDEDDIGRWIRINKRFHDTIVLAQDSRVIADAIARNNHLPFASADSLTFELESLPQEHEKLRTAQLHHQLVFDALERRESARVEMLMREHAWVGFRYRELIEAAGLAPTIADL